MMWYEKLWGWARETVTITVPGVVGVFALTYVLVLAIQAGEAGAAWVQAVGSVVAIAVAIQVARTSQQHARGLWATEAAERDYAHAVRLFTVMWEAKMAVEQLRVQASENINRPEEVEATWGEVRGRPRKQSVLLASHISFFQRIMDRAMHNLDDDLCPVRHQIAGTFRFNLSVLINFFESRVGSIPSTELLGQLQTVEKSFKAGIDKLKEHDSRLAEIAL